MPPEFQDDAAPCPPPPPAEVPAVEPGSRPEPHFSRAITALAALVLVAGLAAFTWLQVTIPPLERVAHPERALTHMVGRMMDLEEAIARAPAWEQALYDLTSGGREYELVQAIQWFEELQAAGGAPAVSIQLAVLYAEAGHLDWIQGETVEWKVRREPFPSYARILTAAYLAPRLPMEEEVSLQGELAELLPEGWFYDRLAINLARKAGDVSLLAATQKAMAVRGDPLLKRARLLAAMECMVLFLGSVTLGIWQGKVRRAGAGWLRMGSVRLPPCWPGSVAVAVLLRGGALTVITIALLLLLGRDDLFFRLAAIPMSNLPLMFLATRHLLAPVGLKLRNGLGLAFPSGSVWTVTGAVLALLAVGLLGEWLIDRIAVSFGTASHWTEWFDPDLTWGNRPVLVVSLLEYVVLAPFFEEVVFRGLVFATLRRRFAWVPAALISATIFAAAHGYGILGFASVLWSGMIWAWAYEKTGSLWPGMIAHALNNFMVCLTLMALLRW